MDGMFINARTGRAEHRPLTGPEQAQVLRDRAAAAEVAAAEEAARRQREADTLAVVNAIGRNDVAAGAAMARLLGINPPGGRP